MRYEFTDYEWTTIKPFLPNKPRGVPRVNGRRVLNGIFWVLRSGGPWQTCRRTLVPTPPATIVLFDGAGLRVGLSDECIDRRP
jgi:transposase